MNRQITIDGNRTAYGTEGGKVLWNFGTSACNVAFQDCNQGPVLAPNGSITAIASHNGSVFAKTVTNTNCEIHQNPFRSQKSAASTTTAALAVGAAVESTGAAWAGTDALAFSVAMGQAVLYFRYLYVALCFPLFFFSVALSRVDGRRITGAVCGLTLAAAVISQAVMRTTPGSPGFSASKTPPVMKSLTRSAPWPRRLSIDIVI